MTSSLFEGLGIKNPFDFGKLKLDSDFRETRAINSAVTRLSIEDHLPDSHDPIITIPKKSIIKTFVISKQTVLLSIDSILPECSYFRKDNLRVVCMADPERCKHFSSKGCTGSLLRRLGKIASFKEAETWLLYIMYWRMYEEDKNKDRRMALAVTSESTDMDFMVINRYALDYFLNHDKEVTEEFHIELGLA